MTIATKGAVKAVSPDEVAQSGAEIILGNTYHLWLRPGLTILNKHGGLHKFMNWSGPILTDSGGYQVFSLSKMRKITDRGVTFRDSFDGSAHLLTPELSMKIQGVIGSDIAMVLDECPSYRAPRHVIQAAVDRTTAWAKRSLAARNRGQLVFGIVQGGNFEDIRIEHARTLRRLPFDGIAVGGVAMGEREQMTMDEIIRVLDWVKDELPKESPHYLMGVGPPDQILAAVKRGIDMFDCVIPTREGRHGRLYVHTRTSIKPFSGKWYKTIDIRHSRNTADTKPVDAGCNCMLCTKYSRAYLRHLFRTQEPFAQRLAAIHNIYFFQELMQNIQKAIRKGIL